MQRKLKTKQLNKRMDKITDKTIAHKELKDDLQMSSESEEDSMSESEDSCRM